MSKMADFTDDHMSVGRGMLRLTTDAEYGYSMGDYMDPRGFVSVYRDRDYTRLDAIRVGRMFIRTWNTSFADRTIPRLAKQFLTDLANVA